MEKTQNREKLARKVTIIGMIVNLLLLSVKFTLGLFGNSAALVSDAVHSLSDFVSDIVVIIGFKLTSKPADENHNYGHGKIETVTAVFIGLVLLFLSYSLLKNSVVTVYDFFVNNVPIDIPKTYVLFAVIASIIAKELMFRYTKKVAKTIKSDTLEANAWHQRSDALSSIAALIGISLAIIFGENFAVMDPIASFVVSLLILKVGIDIIRTSFNQLLDASLKEEEIKKIEEIVGSIEEIRYYHNIRTRKIGYYVSIDIHIHVDKDLNIVEGHNIATKLENEIYREFGDETFISVHIEPYEEK